MFNRYDSYEKKMTEEFYDYKKMMQTRDETMNKAGLAGRFGLILGTLGRQSSTNVLNNFEVRLKMMVNHNFARTHSGN